MKKFLKKLKLHKSNDNDSDYLGELSIDVTGSDDNFKSGSFLNSLENLSEEDIEINDAALNKRRLPMFEVFRKFMFYFFITMFILSCTMLVQNFLDRKKGQEIYKQLEQEFFTDGFTVEAVSAFQPEPGEVPYLEEDEEETALTTLTEAIEEIDTAVVQEAIETASEAVVEKVEEHIEHIEQKPEEEEYNLDLEKIRANLASMQKTNPDLYGWISVAGTNINYPLVQGDDNDYYLEHAYTGDYLPVGSIFVDYRCNTSITKNYNTVIYGHNVMNGTMFHDVEKFRNDEYFNDVDIVIYTMDGIYYYEPFSFYESRYDYMYFRTGFTSNKDFLEFAEEVRDNGTKKKDIEFTEKDRLLTLSTCTNGYYTQRYALHCRLVKTILE